MKIGNIQIGKVKAEAPKTKKRVSSQIKPKLYDRIGLQMDTLREAVDTALNTQNCWRYDLYRLYDTARKDGHVKSQYKIAVNKLLSEPFVILQNGTESKDKTELFNKTWFERFMNVVLDVEFYGYTLCEFGQPHPELIFTYVKAIDRIYVDPYKKEIRLDTHTFEGIPYDNYLDALWLIELGDPDNLGEFESVTKEVIWKNFARSDWSEYNERFGKPLLDIACNTDDPDEVAAKQNMAENFGTNGYIIRDIDDEVNMLSPQGSANGSQFQPKAEFCNSEISKLINGQTGSSDEKAFVGSAEVHERILDDFTKGRLRNVKNIVNDKLMPFLAKKGWPVQGCKLQFPILEQQSNTQKTDAPPADPNQNTPANQIKNKYTWPDWLITMQD